MVTEKRFFDDVTRVASGAAGALGGIRSRIEGELRDQVERLLAHMNLVTREEHEIVAALAAKARSEQEALARRVVALEARLGTPAAVVRASPKPARAKAAPAGKPKRAGSPAGSKTRRGRSPRGEP